MPMSPDEWQERLERHFAELAASRSAHSLPVFALEHGLNAEELSEIGGHLKHRLARGLPNHTYWLLWAIYATEIGYLYDGHDYWPPFEDRTPHWRTNGSPAQLKGWFRRFQRTFNGVVPSGPWATHFNRIAWPITHSILPKLLQDQFARALLEVSRDVARTPDLDAISAGRLLSKYSWGYSSRFQEFLQQEELAGRIMLALLGAKAADAHDAIYPVTLDRIVADLVKVRAAGEWLKEARRIVENRFYGVDRRPLEPVSWEEPTPNSSRPRKDPVSIRPKINLRRDGPNDWSAVIEIPNFMEVAKLSRPLSDFIKTTRCRIACAGSTFFPPGWLLYGTQTRTVKSWPQPNALLIEFERSNPTLDNLLHRESRFSTGPFWAFHVGRDGLANEILSRGVRAGEVYVVLGRQLPSIALDYVSALNFNCDDIAGVRVALPEYVSADDERELHKLGLQLVKSITIWPAGLNIRNWNGDGHGDWLTTETPCFGIVHDHPVDEYFMKLNRAPEQRFEGVRAKQPIFVRLPLLSPGRHILSIRARRIGLTSGPASIEVNGHIELKVRDPDHWKPGSTQHNGLYITTDPHEPTLDDFWDNGMQLVVQGPEGRTVSCVLTLLDKDRSTILSEEIGKFDLPMRSSAWRSKLREFTTAPARAWKYMGASSGVFSVLGEELGEFKLKLERELRQLRWVCTATPHATIVRLVDDTDNEGDLRLEFYPFRSPGAAVRIEAGDPATEMQVADPGGLYVAARAQSGDRLVVSSSRTTHDLRSLIVAPDVSNLRDAPPTQILDLIAMWCSARLAGALPDMQRDSVVKSIQTAFFASICGSRWTSAEANFVSQPRSANFLDQLKASVGGPRSLPAVLLQHPEVLDLKSEDIENWFADAAARYQLCINRPLSIIAIRLAFNPNQIALERPSELEDALKAFAAEPQILRAARFFFLSKDIRDPQQRVVV